jgi:hypothetical protein
MEGIGLTFSCPFVSAYEQAERVHVAIQAARELSGQHSSEIITRGARQAYVPMYDTATDAFIEPVRSPRSCVHAHTQ